VFFHKGCGDLAYNPIWVALRYLRPYPKAPYYFVVEKDILLMLSDDEKHREILKQHFLSSY
jgi:hypothetical protein